MKVPCIRVSLMAVTLAGAMGLTACHHEGPMPGTTVQGPSVTVESHEQVVVQEQALRGKLSFHDLMQRRASNDRLEVLVGIRNRTNYVQNIDVSTAFRDENNAPLNDETAWTRVVLGPNQTYAYSATSLSSRAQFFTVRIREGQ